MTRVERQILIALWQSNGRLRGVWDEDNPMSIFSLGRAGEVLANRLHPEVGPAISRLEELGRIQYKQDHYALTESGSFAACALSRISPPS